jgi:hypothetical protein
MSIVLYPTRQELASGTIKGPCVLIERQLCQDNTERFYSSIFANQRALDRKEHATLNDAITRAVEIDRPNIRMNKPASWLAADPTVAALEQGVDGDGRPISGGPTTRPTDPLDPEG